MTPLSLAASLLTAFVFGGLMWVLVPPTPRLGPRLHPYLTPSAALPTRGSGVARVFGPIIDRIAASIGRKLDPGGEDELALKLRQSGRYPDLGDGERVAAFRLEQLKAISIGAVAGAVVATALDFGAGGVLGLTIVGMVAVGGRTRGALDRALDERRLRMRIEIYTIDQLLALRVRSGGAVVQAVNQVVARGRGEVVRELAEAMRLHRAGMSVSEAFRRMADATPEPACARTYRLLAIADERGVDLAAGLLALAEDVRETRREALKRAATRRRAAMLVPTIALLAPTLLLFVAAPLPHLLTGWR
ncbi:MAG TPA: type II secretion system F family protein [Acidimicrobiia bacterium]|nr:type II secretion system F family protein [Acidimicrobiia bacterium]